MPEEPPHHQPIIMATISARKDGLLFQIQTGILPTHTKATFLDEAISAEHARQHGHTHLFEIIENAKWIRNKAVLLTHFSSRYSIEDIRLAVLKLQGNVSAKVVPLTQGFKSMYST